MDIHNLSLCVDAPEIKQVLNLESGELFSAQKAIGNNYGELEKLRMILAESIAEDKPKYVCPICGVGVYLVRRPDAKKFYFKHRYEDGNCPATTRGNLNKEQINARKYNGVKESFEHIKLKEIVAESLAFDKNFSEIQIEKVWKGQDRETWRKPDVRAIWRNTIPIAFEIQLSTTFLHVIAERRLFYKVQGGLLCWIFRTFDTESARMTQDDLFFNNNRNLFLVSENTLIQSKQQKALILDCHWLETIAEQGTVIEKWNDRFVNFSELTQDLAQQRIFLFDYDGQNAYLTKKATDDALKQQFEDWWSSFKGLQPADVKWQFFRQEFKKRNVPLPEYPTEAVSLLNAIYTARQGKVIGWKHPKFIAAAHTVISHTHKNVMRYFAAAINVYGRKEQLIAEDKEGKWKIKLDEYKERLKAQDPIYDRNNEYDLITAFLFPEVWEKIDSKQNK